ncbi:MAG: hypothetical protein A2X86_19200 [Bdellovibrionales bacterium GWA2_49_15]|nr:MAG: hypothetical protein A2X86_19200 [Bdellovibrionales bacterium GWA2_49_15]HAZ14356.1 hypothetical protein [Bdellovibrionales bacterium]
MGTALVNRLSLILIGLILAAPLALAEDRPAMVEGEGQFISRPSDDSQFVKRQLYASAIEDIYTKVMTEMGLDNELFWKKYNARFDEIFRATTEELKQKYLLQDEKNIEKHPKYAQYESELRDARLNQRAKFGALARSILSYSEKRQSRSTTNPLQRFLTLGAKVDKKAINACFYRFTSESKTRNFTTLFVSANLTLNGVEWKNLGVEQAGDFTTVIDEHWRKWLADTLKAQLTEVKVLGPGQSEEFQATLRADNAVTEQLGPRTINKRLPLELEDALWMKVQVRLEAQPQNEPGGGFNLRIDGDHVLIDLKTRDVIHSQDFPSTIQKIEATTSQTLSSNIASTIYRIPLTSWEGLAKSLANLPEVNGYLVLEVQKVGSISHVYTLLDMLSQKGAGQGFLGRLETYDGQQARILLRYQGDTDRAVNILKKLQDFDVNKDLFLHFDDLAQPYVMSLKPKVSKDGERTQ